MVHNLVLSMLSEFGSELHLFVAWQCNGGMLSSFNAAANCFRRWESLSYNTSAITVSKEKTKISTLEQSVWNYKIHIFCHLLWLPWHYFGSLLFQIPTNIK